MSCHANERKTRARGEAARAKESRERMDRLVVEQRLEEEEEEEATDHTAQKEWERNQDAARKNKRMWPPQIKISTKTRQTAIGHRTKGKGGRERGGREDKVRTTGKSQQVVGGTACLAADHHHAPICGKIRVKVQRSQSLRGFKTMPNSTDQCGGYESL